MMESLGIILFLFLALCLPFLFVSMFDLTFWDSLLIPKTKQAISDLNLSGEFFYRFPQKQIPAVVLTVVIIIAIFSYVKTSVITLPIAATIVVLYFLLKAKIKPFPPVIITDKYVSVYDKTIGWTDIQKIEFTVSHETYLSSRSINQTMDRWAIVLYIDDYDETKIYMASYRNSRQMRLVIEAVARSNGINVRVFDRGL